MLSSSLPFSSTLPRNLAELPHWVLLGHWTVAHCLWQLSITKKLILCGSQATRRRYAYACFLRLTNAFTREAFLRIWEQTVNSRITWSVHECLLWFAGQLMFNSCGRLYFLWKHIAFHALCASTQNESGGYLDGFYYIPQLGFSRQNKDKVVIIIRNLRKSDKHKRVVITRVCRCGLDSKLHCEKGVVWIMSRIVVFGEFFHQATSRRVAFGEEWYDYALLNRCQAARYSLLC